MTLKNCPRCGTKLMTTIWERLYCPNCGIVSDDETDYKNTDNENKEIKYVG